MNIKTGVVTPGSGNMTDSRGEQATAVFWIIRLEEV